MVLAGWQQVELGKDVRDVLFDSPLGHRQRGGNGGVGTALGHQAEDLALAGRELLEAIAVAAGTDQLGYDLRIQCGAAGRYSRECVHEVVEVDDPLLEQVTDAGRT